LPTNNNKFSAIEKLFNIFEKNAKESLRIWKEKNTILKIIDLFKGSTHILTRNNID
jgi:hypothetical protein